MRKMVYILRHLGLVIFLVTGISGCITFNQAMQHLGLASKDYKSETAENLVTRGLEEYNVGKYENAKKIFEDLKSQYPFSEYSLLAELKIADSEFHLNHYKDAALLYEEFETNHPTNEAVPYVMFQTGMCHFLQLDTIDRDTTSAAKAIEAFNRLIRSYPQSSYTEEAKMRVRSSRDFLASHEFYVAQFYLRRGSIKEAEQRLEYLVINYPDSVATEPADKLLAAIKAGNPPKRAWYSFLPEISLPDWKTFSSSLSYGKSGMEEK